MLTFDPIKHEYFVNGIRYPGVTDILTELGLIDKRFFDERSRNRGSIVHRCLALLLENSLDWSTVDPRLLGYVQAGERFLQELKIVPKIIERPFYNKQLLYAGTPDIFCQDGTLIDFKTGVFLKAYELQSGAYKLLLESNGYPVKKMMIVQLSEDGNYKLHPVDLGAGRDWLVAFSYYNLRLNYGG